MRQMEGFTTCFQIVCHMVQSCTRMQHPRHDLSLGPGNCNFKGPQQFDDLCWKLQTDIGKGIAIANACEESSTQTNRLF